MLDFQNRNILLPALIAAIATATGCGGGGSSKTTTNGIAAGNSYQGYFTQVGSLATGRYAHTATYTQIGNNGYVIVAGGRGLSGTTAAVLDTVEVFNPMNGQFSVAKGTMTGSNQPGLHGRAYHAAAALSGGQVVLFGGDADAQSQYQMQSAEMFNPTTGLFQPVAGVLSQPKAQAAIFTYAGPNNATEVVVAGGRQSSNSGFAGSVQTSLTSTDLFHGDSLLISPISSAMPAGVYGAGAAPVTPSEFVIAGGETASSGSSIASPAGFEIFDAASSTYGGPAGSSQIGSSGALQQNRFSAAVSLVGGIPAIIGGQTVPNNPSSALNTIEAYNAQTNSWQSLPVNLMTARYGHTATTLPNGDVIVMGGVGYPTTTSGIGGIFGGGTSNGTTLNTTEIITIAGGVPHVIPGPIMRVARSNHTATLLGNGQILVVGGQDLNGNPIATAEIFAMPGQQVNGASLSGTVTQGGAGAPVLQSLSPTSGSQGQLVTITGTHFGSGANIVRFNGIVAPVQTLGTTQITVMVPNGATTGPVSVQTGNEISTNNPTFTVNGTTGTTGGVTGTGTTQFSGPPSIFLALPSSGGAMMPVSLTGSNYDSGAIPIFNGVPSAALLSVSLTNIPFVSSLSEAVTFVPPAAPSRAGYVAIIYNGMTSNQFPFTVN
jgi:hypothetical protein